MLGSVLFIATCGLMFLLGKRILGEDVRISFLEQVSIYPVVGFIFFTLGLYLFSYVHARNFLWILVLFLVLPLLRVDIHRIVLPKLIPFLSKHRILLIIIMLGVLSQAYLIFPNGLIVDQHIRFYGTNAHDGLWHVALIQSLAESFPPQLPTYSGLPLRGYHYFVDLFASELTRFLPISAFDLFFKMLPVAFSVHLGLASFALMRRLTSRYLSQITAVFLTYFSGSLGFLLVWFRASENSGETIFWAQQSVSTMNNLPLGVSFSVLLVIILLMSIMFQSKYGKSLAFTVGVLVGSMVAIKSYGGLLATIGFSLSMLLLSYRRKNLFFLLPPLLSFSISLLLVFYSLGNGSQIFIYSPGELVKLMMESPDRVNVPQWETTRQALVESANFVGLTLIWAVALIVFVVGNYAHRLTGILAASRFRTSHPIIAFFMYPVIIIGIAMPLFFTQRGTGWNTIQFAYYSLFLMNLLTAYLFSIIRKRAANILLSLVVFVSVSSSLTTLNYIFNMYRSQENTVSFSLGEIAALEFLQRLPNDLVVLAPYDETAYIPAFSGKTVFFSDRVQADVLLTDVDETDFRQVELTRLFVWCKHDSEIRDFMSSNDIDLIYINKRKYPDCVGKYNGLDFNNLIFDNGDVSIYERDF